MAPFPCANAAAQQRGANQPTAKGLEAAREGEDSAYELEDAAAPGRQYNFVDPDSRVMRDNGQKCFVQAYNVQIAVDAHAQAIVEAELHKPSIGSSCCRL